MALTSEKPTEKICQCLLVWITAGGEGVVSVELTCRHSVKFLSVLHSSATSELSKVRVA